MTPQPMETAPAGDGYILGLVDQDDAPLIASRPWAILSRCDDGWGDERGIIRQPRAWVPLPDPQPAPTGWRPAEGTVWVGAARGINWDWKGWLVHVVLPDGEHDTERDAFHLDDPDEALRVAAREGRRLNLPVEQGDMTHDADVIVLAEHRRVQ